MSNYKYKITLIFVIIIFLWRIFLITRSSLTKSRFKSKMMMQANKSKIKNYEIKLVQKFPEAIIIGQAKCG